GWGCALAAVLPFYGVRLHQWYRHGGSALDRRLRRCTEARARARNPHTGAAEHSWGPAARSRTRILLRAQALADTTVPARVGGARWILLDLPRPVASKRCGTQAIRARRGDQPVRHPACRRGLRDDFRTLACPSEGLARALGKQAARAPQARVCAASGR